MVLGSLEVLMMAMSHISLSRLQIPRQMSVCTVVVVCIFLAIGALGWALFVVLDAFGATQTASAWGQAVGSLSAVFTALYVANKQARDTAHARRRRDEVAMKLVCGVAKRADAVSSLLFTNFQQIQNGDEALKTEILTTVEEQLLALRGINPIELPLPEMVEPFLKINGCSTLARTWALAFSILRNALYKALRLPCFCKCNAGLQSAK